ncbi:glycosyltransferase family 1 protein [Cryobacterium melibiosiphilum]|uniref:Glycosyltransferase family 1 protein n=1 Tax=Cryobacterium melibiosiphilum TaxID=995039 RepID=A0A3A5MCF7_9MICO|nr:glycosyltransferase family 1 protein [Cryobacterium melibiosiphilum]RJT87810.1 glycosyltransferase family 1 protein [Cryobacterium melibiosiphilum]
MTLILVDLLFFTGKRGGMESYVREVYSRLPSDDPDTTFIALVTSELAAGDTAWFPGRVIDSGISGDNRVAWAWGELAQVARVARKLGADLIHCPANLGPVWSRVPVVLTVHDLLPFRHPEYVPGAYSVVLRALIRLAARHARRIVTISAASRHDIGEFLRIPVGRVDVTALAGQVRVAPGAGPAPTTVPRRSNQLLAVGNRMPHKNFSALLEALALIAPADRPHLVITGSHGDDPLAPLVARLGLTRWVTLRGWLTAEELTALYEESTIFVFPTLFEGFGLPALEAMALGCPVLCSDIPVLHEVAADAAEFVDPEDPASIAAAISALLASPERQRGLAARGREHAARFTWERTAQQTVASFQRALADR